jgi:TetR/AcrR family acrAB operon transcriptional repressor
MFEDGEPSKSLGITRLPFPSFDRRAGLCANDEPTLARKTKEEALATRELLLDTAESMFLQHGLARTSLNDIALAAGLTRGAVYWHFEDKAALYNALMDRLSVHFAPACSDDSWQGDPIAAVRRMVLLPIELLRSDEQAQRLFTNAMHRVEFSDDLSMIWQRHVASHSEYLEMMEKLFTAAVKDQERCRLTLPPKAAALGLFAMVDGLLTYATLESGRIPALAQAETIVDAYLVGIGCRLPAAG